MQNGVGREPPNTLLEETIKWVPWVNSPVKTINAIIFLPATFLTGCWLLRRRIPWR
jgi:hypothetical protein